MALQVWLPLNGDLKNKGCADVTVTNNGATIDNNGKIGKCYSFDGSDDFISVGGDILYSTFEGGSQPFSIAFWVYHNDSSRAILFGDYQLTGAINFNIELTTSHTFRFYWAASPDKTFTGSSVGVNTWTHVCITYNGSKIVTYINGVALADVYNGVLASKNKTSGVYYLGRDSRTGATALNGRLNDFRIYNHCLSAVEVKEISRGLVLHYKLDEPVASNVELPLTVVSHDSTRTGTTEDVPKAFDGSTTTKWYEASKHVTNIIVETTSEFPANKLALLSANDNHLYNERNLGQFDIYGSNDNSNYELLYSCTDQNYGTAQYTWYYYNFYNKKHYRYYKFSVIGRNAGIQIGEIKLLFDNSVICDCSGYGRNGILRETANTSNDTVRYDACITFNGFSNNITSSFPSFGTEVSFVLWVKFTKVGVHLLDCRNASGIGYQPMWISSSGVQIGGTGNSFPTINYSFNTNVWYHIVVTHDSSKGCLYINGVKIGESTAAAGYNYSQDLPIHLGSRYSSENWFGGNISDFRVYETALSAEDVKQLYEVSGKVDNLGGIHSYEFTEEVNTSTKILKTGIAKAQLVSELLTNQYDNNFYIEPDGSIWVRIVHHNNPTSYKFNSTDPFTTKVYIDENRWFRGSLCDKISGSWELMVKQAATEGGSEIKRRWVQSYNPMTATFAQTAASNVTVNSSAGYTTGWGGVYYNGGTNSYLVTNNGTSGNWWGSIGCWTAYQGGIPGINGAIVTTGYIDMYLRIDNADIDKANFAINSMNGKQLIEI